MAFIRLPLALLATAAVFGVYAAGGHVVDVGAAVLWAPFTFTIVNLVCLVLLLRLTRREGVRLTDIVRDHPLVVLFAG
jgi:hypothetical protein